jgi:hypothetical protein
MDICTRTTNQKDVNKDNTLVLGKKFSRES